MPSGGSAAINGFLYQIIQHLGWLATVSVSGRLDGNEVSDGLLVLEPVQGGGDARAELAGIYLVEQYKSRTGGTWSTAGILDVLRDLRKAIPRSLPPNAEYRFVTDGRAGRLGPLYAFLEDVKKATNSDDLDATTIRDFGGGLQYTNRDFIDHVCKATRTGLAVADERQKVLHLLSHFKAEFQRTSDATSAGVDVFLRKYAPDPSHAEAIRQRLIGNLIRDLAAGELRLDRSAVQTMLRNVDLHLERFENLERLAESIGALTRRRLARIGYYASQDVRTVPAWPADKPVLLIAGESGTGKTWQLGGLLSNMADRREIAALVLTGRTPDETLALAAQDLARTGLGETLDRSFLTTLAFIQKLADLSDAARMPITVARDDVQDVDFARAMTRLDWADWGSRLVMTVPLSVAESLRVSDGDTVHVHRVQEFSVDELDHLLGKHDREWTDLPPDLRRILRNPILAGVYLELPYASPKSAPRSEYEIFERFWERSAARCRPGDMGTLLAMAEFIIEKNSYPLARHQWKDIDLNADAVDRLTAAGWLKVAETGDVSYFHDRLLNWALAKSLVERFDKGRLSREDLATALANGVNGQVRLARRSLGYIPMDAFWLLAEDSQNAEMLADIALQMENGKIFRGGVEALYAEHLSSLGPRAVPVLLALLKSLKPEEWNGYRTKLIGRAFASLASQERVDLTDCLRGMISSSSPQQQAAAIAALTVAPDAACLDRLWAIHRDRTTRMSEPNSGSDIADYRASYDALSAGISEKPEWLRASIVNSDPRTEPVSELAFLLRGLEDSRADAIWAETSELLMKKIPTDRPRSLLGCIARFSDAAKLDFVISQLSSEGDFSGSTALSALAVIDPRRAVEQLGTLQESELYFGRNRWLPQLLRAHPELTRQEILRLVRNSESPRRTIELLYSERPDAMDATTYRYLLRCLERDLGATLEEAVSGNPMWLAGALEVIGGVARIELLSILAEEAGGNLESMILQVARTRVNSNTLDHDHVRESARRFLILTGGDAIISQICGELDSEHHWVRHRGLEWAFVRNDPAIVARLFDIACRPFSRQANGQYERNQYSEFCLAVTALAALGADQELVEALYLNQIPELPNNLAWLRDHCGGMAEHLTNQTRTILSDIASSETELLSALNVAWLSSEPELVSLVRCVLSRADPNSKIACHASIALRALRDQSEEFTQLALRMINTPENEKWGYTVLAGLGDRGLQLLAERVNASSIGQPHHLNAIIYRLYGNPATRTLAVDLAVRLCRSETLPSYMPFDIAAEAIDDQLRERIVDKAFSGQSVFSDAVIKPIEGLAKFDVDRAVEAIVVAFRHHTRIDMALCRLLARLVPEAAPEKLISVATELGRPSLKAAVGRVLRHLDVGAVSRLLVDGLTESDAATKITVEIAGWIATPDVRGALCRLLERQVLPETRDVALASLERHDQEEAVRDLIALFPTSSHERKWSILLAILETGDPYLLTDRNDPLWLGRILSDPEPAIFSEHADESLRRRKEKVS